MLEKVPARLKVIRNVRSKISCRSCETILQAPSPDLPIEKGRPGPGLIANVVVGKYLDGLPLYRQSASSPLVSAASDGHDDDHECCDHDDATRRAAKIAVVVKDVFRHDLFSKPRSQVVNFVRHDFGR